MDTVICGLNKIICRVDSSQEGETVTITNGTNTWTSEVTSGIASFMIPSTPAPAKAPYTITLGAYSRTIEIGFGDSIDIELDEYHEPAYAGQINELEQGLLSLEDRISALETKANAFKNKTMVTASKSGSTLYLTSFVPYTN